MKMCYFSEEKNIGQMFSKTEKHFQKAIPVTTWIRNA